MKKYSFSQEIECIIIKWILSVKKDKIKFIITNCLMAYFFVNENELKDKKRLSPYAFYFKLYSNILILIITIIDYFQYSIINNHYKINNDTNKTINLSLNTNPYPKWIQKYLFVKLSWIYDYVAFVHMLSSSSELNTFTKAKWSYFSIYCLSNIIKYYKFSFLYFHYLNYRLFDYYIFSLNKLNYFVN